MGGDPYAGGVRPPSRRRWLVSAAGVALVLAAGSLTGCGLHQGRTALAIQSATRLTGGVVVYRVECATDVAVSFSRDHGGSDLGEVTITGRPKVGRCHPEVGDPEQCCNTFVDGATSQVVHVRLARGATDPDPGPD